MTSRSELGGKVSMLASGAIPGLLVFAALQLQPVEAQSDRSAGVEALAQNKQNFLAQEGEAPGWRRRRRLPAGAEPEAGVAPSGIDPQSSPPFNPGQNGLQLRRRFRGGRTAGAAFEGPAGPGFGPGFGAGQGFRGGRGPAGEGQSRGASLGSKSLDLTPLELTDEQKEKVKQMRQKTRLKVKDLHQSVLERQAELRRLIFDPDVSEAQIRAARNQLRQLQDKLDETNMNDLLAIRAMLSPEQRKRLPDCLPGRRGCAAGLDAAGPPALKAPRAVRSLQAESNNAAAR
jgi:Spy/CpxP family protein refolding chaperone